MAFYETVSNGDITAIVEKSPLMLNQIETAKVNYFVAISLI